ncbi:phage/conjugal plasmid C-4 type zinc finger protein, TraR family [Enterobacter asburiae]|uniref:Phage/conjugal plasmid C-4 type zinc finger protein, TraR family n=1 Tax=Enterobacter asburiae TaxID=61645 RepID=A0A376F5Y7_ENTAS|nr:phage/conjugal plasmid C-4 type zinc finger protein, TraR family [Enterobacter asburiae]
MASGWANDDAVNEQINSTIEDAVARARGEIPRGESLTECEECGEPIPEAREKPFPAYGFALPASSIKIQKIHHTRDIIAEVRKTASYVDFALPKLTERARSFTLTVFSQTRSKTCPSYRFCKAHPQEV